MALLAAAFLLVAAAPGEPRPSVMLMTGLPLVWGGKGPFDREARPAAAYSELAREFDFRPVDVLAPETLAQGRLLFLAQPQRLAPAELAAVDKWIRNGGRALILTDPMLNWPSELPVGDIRRPPPVGLLSPLLRHWGLALESPAEPGEVGARWDGRRIRLDSPGRLRSAGRGCAVAEGGWTAWCQLGRGKARLVADADLIRDSLWTRADNSAAVRDWLYELTGTSPPPPSNRSWSHYGVVALLLLLTTGGIGILRRRRRAH